MTQPYTENWILLAEVLHDLVYAYSYTIELLPPFLNNCEDRFEIIFLDRFNNYIGNSPYIAKENMQNNSFLILIL